MKALSQVIEKINTVFSQDFLDKLALESGLIKRRRKLCAKKFLENLLCFRFKSAEGSLESLASELRNNGCFISKTGVYYKMNSAIVEFLKKIFYHLLSRHINNYKINFPLIDFITSIRVVDSTKIGLSNQMRGV